LILLLQRPRQELVVILLALQDEAVENSENADDLPGGERGG
jgi:hypothetical protein